MAEELIKLFRYQLGKKQYQELEGTYLELLEKNLSLAELLNLVELVIRWGTKELAITLLWVLATHLQDQGRYDEELRVLRRLVELNPDDEKLTKAITNCLKNLYQHEPLLDKILQKAGLGYGEPLTEALERFDRYFSLMPGRLVYDEEEGSGEIKSLDLLLDRVLVRFDSGIDLTLDVQSAVNRFSFPDELGFFYLKNKEPEKLKELIAKEPAEVVARYLRDIRKGASPSEIERTLLPLIGKENYASFWERAKKGLRSHPHIVVQNRPVRSYLWVDKPEDKVGGNGEKLPKKEKKEPVSEYDTSKLASATLTELLQAFTGLRTTQERKRVLEELVKIRPDWEELYQLLFLSVNDSRSRSLIAEKLQREKPPVWQKLLASVLTDYRANAEAFLFLAERTDTFSARQTVSRLLDIMELDSNRSRQNRAKKLLVAENYRLILALLEDLNEEEASRLLQRIQASRTLEQFQQDDITDLITSKFGKLAPNQESPIVWSSVAGIERAKRELDFLIREELPKSAEELARARAFGDLSENYEYKAAKEKQMRLMEKIRRLQTALKNARALEPDKIDTSQVNIGCRVQLADEEGKIQEFVILGPWDSDPEKGVISFESPMARALLGKKPGESVKMGEKRLLIKGITKAL
ncbi:MAG: GreA/GreB family elongation factor [candidate division WOR-3 bacterium]